MKIKNILLNIISGYILFFNVEKINYKKIIKIIKNNIKNKQALDIGCGLGEFSYEVSKYARFVDAIDNDIKILGKGRKSENINYILSSIEIYFPNKKYDFISCLQVLEHIKDDEYVFKKIASFLKKGGYLLLSTPNKDKILNYDFKITKLLKKLFKKNKIFGDLLKENPHGHEKIGYNKKDFEKFARESNLEIIDVFYENTPMILYEIFFVLPVFARILFYPVFSFINKIFNNLSKEDGLSIYILFRKL